MTKSITLKLEIPEWVDEINRKKELISELNFDEKDLEMFEKVREEVWGKRRKEYGL